MGESGEITIVCNNCDRDIPAPNMDLHRVHCARNLEKCNICGDMVPKKHAEEHFLTAHAEFVMTFVDDNHETKCPGTRNTRGAAQGDGNQRRGRDGKRLFFTVAVTGITVLMGSLFFQKKLK